MLRQVIAARGRHPTPHPQELPPGRPGPSWRGIESGVLHDLPNDRGGHGMAESDQLPPESLCSATGDSRGSSAAQGLGSAVPWVVGLIVGAGKSSGGRRVGRASASTFGVTRAAGGGSLLSALSTAWSSQVSAGRVFVRRSTATRQNLDVLCRVGAREERQPAQHASKHQVGESEGHSGRSCWAACKW